MKRIETLVHAKEIKATKIPIDLAVSSICQDSQKVKSQALYFAIRGTKVDGHSFVKDVLARGAAAVVVEDEAIYRATPNAIWVPSTRRALALAASRWYDEPSRRFSLVGVTGTNGKTTSTFLLNQIWRKLNRTTGLIGTIECEIAGEKIPSALTTPGTLELQALFAQMAEKQVTHASMEVSSIALDQDRVTGSHFAAGLFTNLTLDHLDYHQTFERYFEAKLKLFTELNLPLGIFNRDDEWGLRLERQATCERKIGYGLTSSAEVSATQIQFDNSGTRARLKLPHAQYDFFTPLVGRHNLYNCLGVLAVCFGLGEDLDCVVDSFRTLAAAPGRLERVMEGSSYPAIFVDYAHTDDALKNVLTALVDLKSKSARVFTVFGCGGDRDKTKRPRMGQVASQYSDVTIVTSDNPRTEDPNAILDDIEMGLSNTGTLYHREVDRRNAIHWALSEATPGDIVLIAGKGHETYQILGDRTLPFDDREVVRDFYRTSRR